MVEVGGASSLIVGVGDSETRTRISLGFVEGKISPKAFMAKVRGLVRQCWTVMKKVKARATLMTAPGVGK